jgi:hypothetical protein
LNRREQQKPRYKDQIGDGLTETTITGQYHHPKTPGKT